jgi:hypothetical protein
MLSSPTPSYGLSINQRHIRIQSLVSELVSDDVPSANHLSDGEDTVSLDRLLGIGVGQDRSGTGQMMKERSWISIHHSEIRRQGTYTDTESDPTTGLQQVPPPATVCRTSPNVRVRVGPS